MSTCSCRLALAPAAAPETIWLEPNISTVFALLLADGQAGDQEDGRALGAVWPGMGRGVEPGGESGFLSIAAAPTTTRPSPPRRSEIPSDGKYFIWSATAIGGRRPSAFKSRLEQAGAKPWEDGTARRRWSKEDNEMKLYGAGLRLGQARGGFEKAR